MKNKLEGKCFKVSKFGDKIVEKFLVVRAKCLSLKNMLHSGYLRPVNSF